MEPILPGDRRFNQVKKIASTLQGEIHLAKDASNNGLCIIKTANKWCVRNRRTIRNTRCRENFQNEKAILYYLTNLAQRGNDHRGNIYLSSLRINLNLNTNGIVRIYNEWEDKSWFYYAMEHCNGGDLFDFVITTFKNGFVGLDGFNSWLATVQDIFQQLVLAVAWMHENGICHLDLSLENTMVCKTSKSKNTNKNKNKNKNNCENKPDIDNNGCDDDNDDDEKDNKNDNYNMISNNENETVTVKIIDCGAAKYFGNEDLIKHNKKYNEKKSQTFLGYKNSINQLNTIIDYNKKQDDEKNQMPMSAELKQEYEKIQRDLNYTQPTFNNFQEYYKNNNGEKENGDSIFSYNRCIGKYGYMAPEVMYKVSDDGKFTKTGDGRYMLAEFSLNVDKYDARKADIWSLGVMLFMMCTGSELYKYPDPGNSGFKSAFEGNLKSFEIRKDLPLARFAPRDMLDLLNRIFKPAANRITMDEMLKHPYLRLNLDENAAENKQDDAL